MKYLALFLLVLVSCDTSPKNLTGEYELPPELKDCKVLRISGNWEQQLFVVRCPNSLTATTWTETRSCGKNCMNTDNYSVTAD